MGPEVNGIYGDIQQQLSTFSAGMSSAMSRIAIFTNMEGAVNADDLRTATIY